MLGAEWSKQIVGAEWGKRLLGAEWSKRLLGAEWSKQTVGFVGAMEPKAEPWLHFMGGEWSRKTRELGFHALSGRAWPTQKTQAMAVY